MKFLKIILIIFLLFCLSLTLPIYATSEFVWNNYAKEHSDESVQTNTAPSENHLNLESGSAILIEQSTGQILYNHNMHEQLRPASVTKVMTILLIMEALDSGKITLETQIPCSEKASSMGGSQIWLNTTEQLCVNDMLKAICVVSANDCCVAMAEYLEGSTENFVQKMNEKAAELGMKDTTFKNCHGIDEDGHVSSAYDISLMSRELLLKHPSITNYTTIWMDSLRDGKSELVNTNKLIRNYKGATGLKTGSTSLALYNLSASATRDNLSLIAVIMKAPTTKIRFSEAQKLLDYGFSTYTSKNFGNAGDVIKSLTVTKGTSTSVNAILESSSSVMVKKGQENNIIQNIDVPDTICAPVHKGDVIGKVTFSLDGNIIQENNIILESDISSASFWNITTNLYQKWFNLMR